MKFRLTTQRVRLALIAAGSSGAILAGLFILAVYLFSNSEVQSSYELLRPALRAALKEQRVHPEDPELSDIIDPSPEMSAAFFDDKGKLIKHIGALGLSALDGHGVKTFSNVESIYMGRHTRSGTTVVVALPWTGRASSIVRLEQFLLILYFPLVFSAGFVTWLASRSTFRPLDELARQAETLSATNLSRRLDLKREDEYALVAARLNHFLDLIQTSVLKQERFVADAAHELRTPLTVMRGKIETTLLRSRSAEDYRTALEISLSEAERLSRLVEGLLISAAANASPVKPLRLEDALEEAQARWVDRFEQAKIHLVVEDEPAIAEILPEECDSVLDNLIGNAFKHSPPGTTCTVRLWSDKTSAYISVSDQGPGVPPELRDTVFERFTRGEASRNRQLGGFGIGLAVCKRIVESRGGHVSLQDSNVGASFLVQLPLTAEEPASTPEPIPAHA